MSVTMRQMLEAGVHFGHQTRFWNPKMAPYIFGHRNKIHIINLERTLEQFNDATRFVRQLAANRGTLLLVGTKRQARDTIVEEAKRCGMPFVDQRWLGGMLTNFKTVKVSIKRLKEMEQIIADSGTERMTKKEALDFAREVEKLNKSIGGIKDMNALPDALFVIDVGYHKIAVQEAAKLGIPVVAIVDTNHSPEGIAYVIPGNDDSSRAVRLTPAALPMRCWRARRRRCRGSCRRPPATRNSSKSARNRNSRPRATAARKGAQAPFSYRADHSSRSNEWRKSPRQW